MRELDTLKSIFENHLYRLEFPAKPEGLYDPNRYFLQIGGKRLRPALLLLACEIYSGKAEKALDAAVAVELFHNFSLIHDDVMDNASVRRGYRTIHEKYGINTAILSGDVMLSYAYNYLAKVPEDSLKPVFDIFNHTAIAVCEGQQMDMDFERRSDVTEEEYLLMIKEKTSVLLAAAMQIGAIIGGAPPSDSESLYQYALHLGIAFQIQDDILDCYGRPDEVGKTPGGDIMQNKKTILNIRARQQSQLNNDPELMQWEKAGKKLYVQKVKSVLSVYHKYGVREYAERVRDEKVNYALEALTRLNISEKGKKMLANICEHLVYRAY